MACVIYIVDSGQGRHGTERGVCQSSQVNKHLWPQTCSCKLKAASMLLTSTFTYIASYGNYKSVFILFYTESKGWVVEFDITITLLLTWTQDEGGHFCPVSYVVTVFCRVSFSFLYYISQTNKIPPHKRVFKSQFKTLIIIRNRQKKRARQP